MRFASCTLGEHDWLQAMAYVLCSEDIFIRALFRGMERMLLFSTVLLWLSFLLCTTFFLLLLHAEVVSTKSLVAKTAGSKLSGRRHS